jgi:filamentous hemagglutinin family protein
MNPLARRIVLGPIAAWVCVVQAAPPVVPAPPAPTQLPVPCQTGACNNSSFVSSGTATAVAKGTNLTVKQSSNSTTLNWASFNIGANGTVVFQQPSSTAVALNRIYDANPSSIFGSLSANGQIYLINANGFLFGATSTVNVAGLIASSLNITDTTFTNGILSPVQVAKPALEPFTGNSQHFSDDGPNGAPQITNVGAITVENGAQLTAADGGRLLLAASTVQNAGSLSAPDGQIVLAAGQSAYLQAAPSSDTALRGLIVQVDAGSSAATQLASATVYNEATGSLSAPRGNITLAGLMVNQDGRISATTSVAANGSVTLTAGTHPITGGTTVADTQGGQVVIGADSDIEILPELTDTATAVAAQTQLPSTVTITGEQVLMHGGTIRAPGGNLTVTATPDPANTTLSGSNSAASIRIDAGTTIDLSGSDATLPMDANLVTVQLRSNEFADDPTQRNGALRGDTVTVDVRADGGAGTPIANVASAIAAVGQTIAQRTETGGTATFESLGDIVFNPAASINVSGGATTYLGGTIQTTKLVGANGQIYDIGSANPLLTYTGIINPTFTQTYDKWGVQEIVPTPGLSQYEATYTQGAAAGTVQFAAPSMVLQGNLLATATSGPYQRAGTTLGGTLIIGSPSAVSSGNTTDFLAPPIEIVLNPIPISVADTAALPVQTLQLPSTYLTDDGFTNMQIVSNTSVKLPAGLPLSLPAGATFAVQASRIDIDSSITALGGSLSFESEFTVDAGNYLSANSAPGLPRLGIGIGDGVTLNVSGQWTNDSVLAGGVGTQPTLQNGGTINLQLTQPTSELVLGNQVSLRADAGAWEQGNGTVTYGKGGSLTLDASPAQAAIQFGQGDIVEAFGAGTASGGSFTLLAPGIDLSQGIGSGWTEEQRVDNLSSQGGLLNLYAPLLSDYGFSNISLTATGAAPSAQVTDVLIVEAPAAAGTPYLLQTQTLELDPGYQTRSSGGTIAGFAQPTVLQPYQRPVANLSLNALRLADDLPLGSLDYGTIDVKPGVLLLGDDGASMSISGEGSINIGGTLRAPGGEVSVHLVSPALFNSSTSDALDPGFLANLGITLAATADIDVSGAGPVLTPNVQGLLLGTVSGGGSVSLTADRGTVFTASGSQINFSGSSATLDVANSAGTYTREVVATSAGSLTVSSVESIGLLGTLNAQPGVGNSGAASGGSLEIDLARALSIPGQPDVSQPLQINVVSSTATSNLQVGAATLGVAQILTGSGIESLTLNAGGTAPGEISFQTGQALALDRSLVLESESLAVADGVTASITAPYVEIGNPLTLLENGATQPAPSAGTGMLNVAAKQLTLLGNVTLLGVEDLALSSQGDIQLQGTPALAGGLETGSLSTTGNIQFLAQRIYPDTFTNFTISAPAGTGSTVSLDSLPGSSGAVPGAPLSAGGMLSVSADHIEVGGNVYAPFGSISLTANQTLQLSNGSLVSVSGSGLDVPYGQTQLNGAQWIYTDSAGTINTITGVPSKGVSLNAPNVSVQPQATVNLQGGGDLYSYEWVPGTGGSKDALATSALSGIPNLYAIIPAEQGQAAPYDPQVSGPYSATQTVYLSGGAGIAAGYYALLPPRYALAPGAVLVQLEPSYTSASGGQIGALANGTPVIGGFLSSAGTTLHSGATTYEGIAIYPSGYAGQLAAYTISNASSYFSAAAAEAGTGPVAEPADAGVLNLSVMTSMNAMAGTSLSLQGTVETAAASGGRGAAINISAPNLEISSDGSTSSAGFLGVSATVLQGWNAGEITLGGSAGADSNSAVVSANHVVVDGGVSLTADQIFVVAHQDIDINSGASLASTSGKAGTPLSTPPAAEPLTLSDPAAAFVAVSDLGVPLVTRSGLTAGTAATVELDAGSTLSSGGALVLDSPGNMTLNGTLNGKGASWSLGSNSIAFVGASGAAPDTLNIDANLAQALQAAGSVRLSSQSSIDLLAPVTLGALSAATPPTLAALTLLGTSINNENSGSSSFGAATLTLGGVNSTTNQSPITPVAGSGTLSLVANALNLAPGTTTISGFASTQAQVAGALSSAAGGVSGLNAAGDLTINAVEITPGAGSSTTIAAAGTLSLGAPTTLASGSTMTTLVGGALALQANSIMDNGAIAAPSGIVTLNALAGDVHLGSTGSISVAGTLLPAVDRDAPSPGGTISLQAAGNVTLDSGSNLNVAGEQTAPAGSVTIAGGVVSLAGTLTGTAGNAGTGGSFSLDAAQLTGGLAPLASSLMSGGFSNAINLRVQSGDLLLPAGGSLTANNITLTADSGAVDIAGVLSAPSAAQRGLIDLSGQTVVLENGAALHADGAGANGIGGEIELNATCSTCSITLEPGSVITAAGASQMGELTLRAPALQASNDVAINTPATGITGLGADVTQAGQVIIDPVLAFATSNATIANDLPNDVTTASNYLTAASPVIQQRLANPATSLVSSTTPPLIEVGVELQDSVDVDPTQPLMVPGIDLSFYSTGQATGQNQVVNLNVRAVGSIAVTGTITDGFVSDPTGNTTRLALSNTPSASLSIVAGADLSSANPLSTLRTSTASLTLLSSDTPNDGSTDLIGPTVVRTGTGDINLAAAGNIVFASGAGGGAAVYTGGVAPANVTGPIALDADNELMNFGAGGGSVRLTAGGNVVGTPVGMSYSASDNGNYGVNGWLLQQGNARAPAEYGVDYGSFDWNVGALGGGDVVIQAGGSVTNLSAATADSLSAADNNVNGVATKYGAGGGLTISAGTDIGSAQIYVADGVGTLLAGGGLTTTRSYVQGALSTPAGSAIALGDSQVSAWVRTGLQVDAIYNPTYVVQANASESDFFTYGADSAVNLSTTSGAATLQESGEPNSTLGTLVGKTAASPEYLVAPPTLSIQALQNDIDLIGGPILAPASNGQLSLFAGRDISGGANASIIMSDATVSALATAADPGLSTDVALRFQGVVHASDPNPALVTAGRDIVNLNLSIPKAAEIVAGRDITDLDYAGQNISPNDDTLIAAGRDLTYTGSNASGIQLGGPGSLDLLTGRNLDLGFGGGIVTVGSLVNANLPTSMGANVNLRVGYGSGGADLGGFLSKIIVPSSTYQTQLIDYVESLDDTSGLNFAAAETAFDSLSNAQQSALIDSVFFNELLLSGRAANSGSGVGFQQGYNAIDALFPDSRSTSAASPSPYAGNLTLTTSQIYTDSGGNISILVPGGDIDVGLANPPPTVLQKPASELGIVAEGSGNVDIYALGDVNVNESRVFTLGGGNILIWSTLGSIDAGNGSKSSLSVPPPTVTVSATGVVTLSFGAALAAGSGIRTIQTTPAVPPGNVDLDAPVGTVNAGDAGIGAAGNINIAAAHVIGVDNINFGGTATGVPSDLSSLGATLSGASSAAAGTTNSSTSTAQEGTAAAKETAPLAQTALSWLDVFVTGLGDENCKPDDLECLKRQKQASP